MRGKSSSSVLAVSSLRRPLDIWETVGKAEVREEVRVAESGSRCACVECVRVRCARVCACGATGLISSISNTLKLLLLGVITGLYLQMQYRLQDVRKLFLSL